MTQYLIEIAYDYNFGEQREELYWEDYFSFDELDKAIARLHALRIQEPSEFVLYRIKRIEILPH